MRTKEPIKLKTGNQQKKISESISDSLEILTKLIIQTVKRRKTQITNIVNKIGVIDMNSIDIEDEKKSTMKNCLLSHLIAQIKGISSLEDKLLSLQERK